MYPERKTKPCACERAPNLRRRENEALTTALDHARRRWRHLAATLHSEGLTTTQTAKALGISRAAVDKLVTRTAADTPASDPTALADGGQLPAVRTEAPRGAGTHDR